MNEQLARDGENLHAALDEARRKALEWRQKATAVTAEAERQELIVAKLEEVLNLTRCPANSIKKQPAPAAQPNGKKGRAMRPHGFWQGVIVQGIESWKIAEGGALGRGPTKKELAKILRRLVPDASEPSIFSSIYGAIQKNQLIYRLDFLYLPGTEPPPKIDTPAARAARM